MKKYLLPSALILVLGLGYALAQNITKAIQLSQDASGAFGVDTANNVYFPAHVLNTAVAGAPVLSSCSTATVAGSDFAGTISGAAATNEACTLTFKTAYLAAPTCVVISQNSATSPIAYNAVATGINLTTFTGTATGNYICTGAR